jgi:hypothetical protein
MQLSPFDPKTTYIGANVVLKSADQGRSYQPISPDLTTNTDRETLPIMGVVGKEIKIAKHDGVSSFGNIVTLEESAARAGVVWVGSDDGVVSVTQDAGKTWSNVTSKIGVPKFTYVSDVLPSRAAAGTAYVTFDGHRGGDYNTYVYTTADFGATWKSLAGNLPKGEVVRTIAEDRKNPDLLYLGTETGLWVSWNRGGQWTRLQANLPTIPIYEIKTHPRDNDMILATHARGIWILDDLGIIQQWAKSESAAGAAAFEPEPVVTFNTANDQMKGFEGDRLFLGMNPAPGATLGYRLKADAKEVKWTIRDGSGTVIREITGDAMKDRNQAGLNLVKWDLRVEPLKPLPPPPGAPAGAQAGGGGGFFGGTNNGPFVLPGTYRAALSVDGKEVQTLNVAVKGDPEIRISDADRKIWFDTAMDVHQLQGKANEVAEMVQNANAQLQQLQNQAKSQTLPANVKQSLDGIAKEMEVVRRRLGLGGQGGGGGFGGNTENVRGRIGQLKGAIVGSTSVPTNTQLQQIREAKAALPVVIDQANAIAAKMPGLVKEMLGAGAIFPTLKPVGK